MRTAPQYKVQYSPLTHAGWDLSLLPSHWMAGPSVGILARLRRVDSGWEPGPYLMNFEHTRGKSPNLWKEKVTPRRRALIKVAPFGP